MRGAIHVASLAGHRPRCVSVRLGRQRCASPRLHGPARPRTMSEARPPAGGRSSRRSAAKLFFDPSLSGSGQIACATCHDPSHAFGPPNALPVQLGGGDLRQPGLGRCRRSDISRWCRNSPSISSTPRTRPTKASTMAPTGGLTWDGRADRGHDQARIPLLRLRDGRTDAGHGGRQAPCRRLRGATCEAICGAGVVDDPRASFAGLLKALEVFQQDYRTFYPYTQQVRRVSRRQGQADAPGGPGAEAVQRAEQGQLCGLPHQPARQ